MRVLGIDASRCRSGGAIDHLIGILTAADFARHGFRTVHVWAPVDLAAQLPAREGLFVHSPAELAGSLPRQLAWQALKLSSLLRKHGVDLLFTADASSLCRFRPAVALSQDALSYEPGIKQMFGWGRARARLEAIKYLQNANLRRADGVIFLTRYAAELIQRSCGPLNDVRIVPHGVHARFLSRPVPPRDAPHRPARLLYVSNYSMYKNQWTVVDALGLLRAQGEEVELHLVGGGDGPGRERTHAHIQALGEDARHVHDHGRIPHDTLPDVIAGCDVFVFASRCETISITLLEGMAMGVPIASSSAGPMPEVLRGTGELFDPESPSAIAAAVARLLHDPDRRRAMQAQMRAIAPSLTWARCAEATFDYLNGTIDRIARHDDPSSQFPGFLRRHDR